MSNQPHFAVRTENFEGPFDALLTMIEKKKLHIAQVSLATIADDYIDYVRQNEFQLREATMFIWTAATLMLIKSRHLLPQFLVTDEEEEDISGLETRLKIYAIFKKQMEKIESTFGTKRIHQRIFKKQVVIQFRPDERITQDEMRRQIEDVFTTVEPETFIPEKAVAKTRSLSEITADIARRVKQFVNIHFHELVNGLDRKEHAISFLAVLELFRLGEVDLEQDSHFARIKVSSTDNKKTT